MWPRRTNCRRLSMEGMLLGHKVPTTALPEEQVFHSSSFQIFASCLYSVCMFAEHIHWTFFFTGSEGFCIGMNLRGHPSPTCHTKQESFRVHSWDVLTTCLQTFRGRMVTRAEPTPANPPPSFSRRCFSEGAEVALPLTLLLTWTHVSHSSRSDWVISEGKEPELVSSVVAES